MSGSQNTASSQPPAARRKGGRERLASLMERRRGEESWADYEQIRRDWVLGSEAFRQELLAAVVERVGPSHYRAQRQETGLQKAERIVREEMERLGWREDELRGHRKGHRAKVLLARRLRHETTMSLKWIAESGDDAADGHSPN